MRWWSQKPVFVDGVHAAGHQLSERRAGEPADGAALTARRNQAAVATTWRGDLGQRPRWRGDGGRSRLRSVRDGGKSESCRLALQDLIAAALELL